MSGSFELILDTTGPSITVNAPKYAVLSSITNFEIIGSENLSPDQDFYFMDAAGKRHDLIFTHEGNYFQGQVSFSSFAEGIATFYGQVKDDVFNLSPVFTHSIRVESGTNVDVEIEDRRRNIAVRDNVRFTELLEDNRKIESADRKRKFDIQESIRKMGVEVDG